MEIITSIKNAVTPSPTDYTPIQPTRNDAVDGPVLVLLLLTALGSDSDGYSNMFWIGQYLFQVEEELVERDIPVNRYTWETVEYYEGAGKYPRSQGLHDHLDLLVSANEEEPVLYRGGNLKVNGDRKTAYRPTGYTDLYIQKFGDNTVAEASDVEAVIRDVLDEYGPMGFFDYHDELVEQYPEKYF